MSINTPGIFRMFWMPDGPGYGHDEEGPPPPPDWLMGGAPTPAPQGYGQPPESQYPMDDDFDGDFGGITPEPPPYQPPVQGGIGSYRQSDFYSDEDYSAPPAQADEFDQDFDEGEVPPAPPQEAPPPLTFSQEMPSSAVMGSFQQPSIKDYQGYQSKLAGDNEEAPMGPPPPRADPGTGSPPAPGQEALRASAVFAPPSLPDLELEEQLSQQSRPNYASQAFGEGVGGGLDADGMPRYVPDLPELQVDKGAVGRRVAGIAWLFFAGLMALASFLRGGELGMGFSMVMLSPMMLTGLLMLTGTKWSGVLGIILGVVYSLLLIGVGILANLVGLAAASGGLDAIPPEIGMAIGGVGVFFLIATLMMLINEPGTARATIGAFLLVLPQVGATAWLSTMESTYRLRLTQPVGSTEETREGSYDKGFVFIKPAGWASYKWDLVQKVSPMADKLTTEPDYYFLNDRQDMMIAFYLAEPPRVKLTDLFNTDPVSEIEKELIRDLPKIGDSDTFDYAGLEFTESSYAGIIANGRRITITIDKTRLGDQLFVVALIRDAASRRTTQEDADTSLNTFFKTLEFNL